MFYMREGNLYSKFHHKIKGGNEINGIGRSKPKYIDGDDIWAILTSSDTEEKNQYHGLSHNTIWTITHRGMPIAKPEDILIMEDGREFYIRGVENPANIGLWTIYNTEERCDINAGEHSV